MFNRSVAILIACSVLGACASDRTAGTGGPGEARGDGRVGALAGEVRVSAAEPLVIGESFTVDSTIMGEARRVNILVPTVYGQRVDGPMPVLYMLDGGLDEDFLHVAGLVQVLVSNGSMRPFVLVGIPNTQRRRDMTGPTSSEEDRKIAPVVGGSATFRRFIKEELMPTVKARYRTTDEAAIVGESLAGLFVVETLLVEPGLFDTYIAIDPSVWWDNGGLVKTAEASAGVAAPPPPGSDAARADRKAVFLASSSDDVSLGFTARLAKSLESRRGPTPGTGVLDLHYAPLPAEGHSTIYHPAALLAFRTLFAPNPAGTR